MKPSYSCPTDRVQTYKGNLAQSKSRKDLANWSWVNLAIPELDLPKVVTIEWNKESGRDPMTIQMTEL